MRLRRRSVAAARRGSLLEVGQQMEAMLAAARHEDGVQHEAAAAAALAAAKFEYTMADSQVTAPPVSSWGAPLEEVPAASKEELEALREAHKATYESVANAQETLAAASETQGKGIEEVALKEKPKELAQQLQESGPFQRRSAALKLARRGAYVEVRWLLKRGGVDVNCRDHAGNTLLHLAAQSGHGKIIKMLTRYGADLDAQNMDGNTAAHFAFKFSFHAIVDFLVGKGFDVALRNKAGLLYCEGTDALLPALEMGRYDDPLGKEGKKAKPEPQKIESREASADSALDSDDFRDTRPSTATALAVAGHFAPQDNARPDTPDSPLAKGGDNTDFAALALAN
jgi:hypothetical protein